MSFVKALEKRGYSQDRLRKIFEAIATDQKVPELKEPEDRDAKREPKPPKKKSEELITQDQLDKAKKMVERHAVFVRDGLRQNYDDAKYWKAIDLAYDIAQDQTSTTIARAVCDSLLTTPADQDATEEILKKGQMWGIEQLSQLITFSQTEGGKRQAKLDAPIFFNYFIPLVSGYLKARWARLWSERNTIPLYKYDPANPTTVNHSVCKVITNEVAKDAENMGYRNIERSAIHATLMYGYSWAFAKSDYYTEKGLFAEGEGDGNLDDDEYIIKEGIQWEQPHPSKVFFDRSAPMDSINTDTGVRWAGYWAVMPYRSLKSSKYWNLDRIAAGAFNETSWVNARGWGVYTQFYPCALKFPSFGNDITNSREERWYNDTMGESAVQVVTFVEKISPKECGLYDCDIPIWHKFIYAGDGTVISCIPFFYTPANVGVYDADPNRARNTSLALELVPFQDGVGNLITQHIITIQKNLEDVVFVNQELVKKEYVQKIYLNHRKKTLVHGPRKVGKSNICQNIMCEHAFRHDGAIIGIVVKGKDKSISSGCWNDITGSRGLLEQHWFKSDTNTGWAKRGAPRMASDTKMRYCRIRTGRNTEAEFQMHTLQKEDEIDKFKDSRFSALYLVEADRWDGRGVMKLNMQLRVSHIPHPDRKMILDCNPPELGEKHWLHEVFFKDKNGKYPPDIDPNLMEVGIRMEDNPFLTDEEKYEIYTEYSYDENELKRNWGGEWIQSLVGTAFGSQFNRNIHVIGDPKQKTGLLPPPSAFQFVSGWDLGEAMNHACVLGCKVLRGDKNVLYLIDEIVKTGVNYSIDNFGHDFLEMAGFWYRFMRSRGNKGDLLWRFWSDSSSLRYNATADGDQAKELRRMSRNFIKLSGVKKGSGSVKQRINRLRRALHNKQIIVSATKCPNVVKMLETIKTNEFGSIDEHDPQKHIFDAVTYLMGYELPPEYDFGHQDEGFIVSA